MIHTIILATLFLFAGFNFAFADLVATPTSYYLTVPPAFLFLIVLIIYLAARTVIFIKQNTIASRNIDSNESTITNSGNGRSKNSFVAYMELLCCALFLITLIFYISYRLDIYREGIESKNRYPVTRAKQGCDFLVRAIQKYYVHEGCFARDRYMEELKGKYIVNLELFIDPWGNPYENDYKKGIIYSKGQDGKHKDFSAGGTLWRGENKDDIVVPYIGALTLTGAKVEINPEGGDYRVATDTVELTKCYDRVHLYFNKDVSIPSAVDLGNAVPANSDQPSSTTNDDGTDKIFRYFDSANPKNKTISAPADLSAATASMIVTTRDKLNCTLSGAGISYGADSREIIIKYSQGFTCANPEKKLLMPAKHFINITGAKNNKNKLWFEPEGADGTGARPSLTEGAESAGMQIPIEMYKIN